MTTGTTNTTAEPTKTRLVSVALVFSFVILLWAAWWWIVPALTGTTDAKWRASDMYGPLNTLFAGLAFAGLTVAIFLQRDELMLQRQELADTRVVLSQQHAQLKEQASTMQAQAFENRYFSLLALVRQTVAMMPPGTNGTEFFKKVGLEISQNVLVQDGNFVRFDQIWDTNGGHLAPYLRAVNTVVRFSQRSPTEPDFFVSLLFDQMTLHERAVLAFCVRADKTSEPLSLAVHRHQVFADLQFKHLGQHAGADMLRWINAKLGVQVTDVANQPDTGGSSRVAV